MTAPKIRGVAKVLLGMAAVVYPGLIFYFLVIRKIQIRQLSLFVMAFAVIAFITATSKKKVKASLSA